jgi:acyl carrier protein
MTKEAFLLAMDELLELQPGTLTGAENLDDLENWTSMSMLQYIALVDSEKGVQLSPRLIKDSTTIADLLRLAKIETSEAGTAG